MHRSCVCIGNRVALDQCSLVDFLLTVGQLGGVGVLLSFLVGGPSWLEVNFDVGELAAKEPESEVEEAEFESVVFFEGV